MHSHALICYNTLIKIIMEAVLEVNIETKLSGLLGYPLSQSLSALMQNAAFKECLLNKIYIPIEVTAENLETVVRGISKMNFDGFNITKPYKIEIMKYLDETDEYARLIGAVNTVAVKNGMLKGYNTDGTGFLRSFEEKSGTKIEGKTVFILGCGGAARAVSMTLALNNSGKIYICNRTYESAVSLAEEISIKTGRCNAAVPMVYKDMEEAIGDSDVLINCTSVGMIPGRDETPLDKSLLNRNLTVCDVIYNPRRTRLIRDAEEAGSKTVTGEAMLVYQGAEAFELWTKKAAPVKTMFDVVNNSLNL
ncbi:MAG TPA: shikimate dehydrogenase [Clostridiales bacterium]|nr:shikimate dehydrogenase [Clostridiales bacterium]